MKVVKITNGNCPCCKKEGFARNDLYELTFQDGTSKTMCAVCASELKADLPYWAAAEIPTDSKYLGRLDAARSLDSTLDYELIDYFLRAANHPFEEGYPSTDIPWPFKDVTWDDYDSSFELKGCRDDWTPNEELIQAGLKLGFTQFWACYEDGSEIHGPRSDGKSLVRKCHARSPQTGEGGMYHTCQLDKHGSDVDHKWCC